MTIRNEVWESITAATDALLDGPADLRDEAGKLIWAARRYIEAEADIGGHQTLKTIARLDRILGRAMKKYASACDAFYAARAAIPA